MQPWEELAQSSRKQPPQGREPRASKEEGPILQGKLCAEGDPAGLPFLPGFQRTGALAAGAGRWVALAGPRRAGSSCCASAHLAGRPVGVLRGPRPGREQQPACARASRAPAAGRLCPLLQLPWAATVSPFLQNGACVVLTQ